MDNRLEIVNKLRALHHKDGVNRDDWHMVHANLILIADFVYEHCAEHHLPLVITSIIRKKIPGVSKTDIHSHGRAFDVSVKGWQKQDIEFLVKKANDLFKVGAISIRDGKEREAIYENGIPKEKGGTGGKGAHLHFQVRK